MTFLTIFGFTWIDIHILLVLVLVLEGNTNKEITESLKIKFSLKIFKNNFALSGAENNT